MNLIIMADHKPHLLRLDPSSEALVVEICTCCDGSPHIKQLKRKRNEEEDNDDQEVADNDSDSAPKRPAKLEQALRSIDVLVEQVDRSSRLMEKEAELKIVQHCNGLRKQIDSSIQKRVAFLNKKRDDMLKKVEKTETFFLNNLKNSHAKSGIQRYNQELLKNMAEKKRVLQQRSNWPEPILDEFIEKMREATRYRQATLEAELSQSLFGGVKVKYVEEENVLSLNPGHLEIQTSSVMVNRPMSVTLAPTKEEASEVVKTPASSDSDPLSERI